MENLINIIKQTEIADNSIILFDKRYVHADNLRKAFRGAAIKAKNVCALPVEDLSQPVVEILSEVELNKMGWTFTGKHGT